jgi:hypothetical protein
MHFTYKEHAFHRNLLRRDADRTLNRLGGLLENVEETFQLLKT